MTLAPPGTPHARRWSSSWRLAWASPAQWRSCPCAGSASQFTTFPVVQFGWPEPHEIRIVYMPDRDLFWVTRDYAMKLGRCPSYPASGGLHGRLVHGVWHVATADARSAGRAIPRSRAAVAGGRRLVFRARSAQFRRDVLPLHPRLVTIYYGWNDHWLAFGEPDADVHANAVSYWLAEHLRLAQLVVKARLGTSATPSAGGSFRVPLDRLREHRNAGPSHARRGHQGRVDYCPTSHERGREPEYLARRHLRDLKELVPLHASYVQATREAAVAAGAEVCDAATMFTALPGPIGRYFNRDGIHFSDRGSRALADMLAHCVAPDWSATSHVTTRY